MLRAVQAVRCRVSSGRILPGVVIGLIAVATAGPSLAKGTQADELRRTQVHYQQLKQCNNSQSCYVVFANSPKSENKRLEIHNLSCRVQLDTGYIHTAELGNVTQRYEYLVHQINGQFNGNQVIIVRNSKTTVAEPDSELHVQIFATGEIQKVNCNAHGEIVKYKK